MDSNTRELLIREIKKLINIKEDEIKRLKKKLEKIK